MALFIRIRPIDFIGLKKSSVFPEPPLSSAKVRINGENTKRKE
jgi:hypothetical protein